MIKELNIKESQLNPQEVLQASTEFLHHFGVEADPLKQPDQFREALAQLDPRYQGGRELVRWQLEADQTKWDDPTKNIIMHTAESMRMLELETPLMGHFDAVIVLAGARQSNIDRAKYAVQCAHSTADFNAITVAASIRKLNDSEKENVANYAPGAETEADLADAVATKVIQEEDNRLADANHVHPKIIFFGKHIVESERAGTPDVIEKALKAIASSERGRANIPNKNFRIGAVTTQIYQASTELDLARVAKKFGITETFTAGNPSDPNVIAKRTPATYLSEILRTLRAVSNALQAEQE